MNTGIQNLLFELIESEADLNLYIIRDGSKAEIPAITITSSPVGHFPRKRGDRYTLWFGRGIERWTFKTFPEAVKQAKSILARTKAQIQILFDGPLKQRASKLWEAAEP